LNIDENHTNARLQNAIFAEQGDMLYTNLLISVPSNLLCATIVFMALYRIPHTSTLLYWFMGTIALTVFRLLLCGFYLRDHQYTKARALIFLFGVILAAAFWSVAGFILMPPDYRIEQMVVIVVISGVTAGGLQSLQASLLACLIYITFLILPLATWNFLQHDIAYTILGSSLVLYFVFTLSISLRSYRFLRNTLIMKYENIYLTNNVSSQNKQLQQMNQDLAEKENNLRLIHDNAPIGMAIVSLDGRWLNVNNKLCEIVGYSKEELENLTIQELTYPEDAETDLEAREKLLSGKLQSYQIEKRYINKKNQLIWILTNVSIVRGKGDIPLYYISQIQDINEKKLNENIMSSLSHMNSMLQLCHNSLEAYPIISHAAQKIFTELSGGLAILHDLTNEQEVVDRWGENPSLKSFFRSNDCWAFRSGKIYIANDPRKDAVCHHFETPPLGGSICMPLIVQGQVLGMLNFSASANHTITSHQQQIINNFSEIVKLSLANIHLNEALSEQAIHDPLTGLLNRRYLYECLPTILQHALRTREPFCVCMIDLDFFKNINDVYGHDAGDEVLKLVGALLKNNIRESDVACRFGGEEFILILQSTQEHAHIQMERIRSEVKNTKVYSQNHLLPSMTVSIGIAEAPRQGETINEILRIADAALYQAKEAGRDRVIDAQEKIEV